MVGYGLRRIVGIAIGRAIHTLARIAGQDRIRIHTNLLSPDKIFTSCLQIEGCATISQLVCRGLHALISTNDGLVVAITDDTVLVAHKSGTVVSSHLGGVGIQQRVIDADCSRTSHHYEASIRPFVDVSDCSVVDTVADS